MKTVLIPTLAALVLLDGCATQRVAPVKTGAGVMTYAAGKRLCNAPAKTRAIPIANGLRVVRHMWGPSFNER